MKTRENIATALALIGIGAWFLAIELFPIVKAFAHGSGTWPLQIIGIGAGLAVISLLTWVPGMLIPACIVGGIGGLLYWQNMTGNWGSWAYAWSLIPGFIGVGILLSGLLNRQRGAVLTGFWMVFYSVALFLVFGSFLGGWSLIQQFWPLLLVAAGLILLLQGLFRRR